MTSQTGISNSAHTLEVLSQQPMGTGQPSYQHRTDRLELFRRKKKNQYSDIQWVDKNTYVYRILAHRNIQFKSLLNLNLNGDSQEVITRQNINTY